MNQLKDLCESLTLSEVVTAAVNKYVVLKYWIWLDPTVIGYLCETNTLTTDRDYNK